MGGRVGGSGAGVLQEVLFRLHFNVLLQPCLPLSGCETD